MIFLGVVCLILGLLLAIPILVTIGIVLVVLGLILFAIRPGGRRYY
jgi:hypothetical protein